ncbi:hypothetical protein C8J57DRAFT_1562945 [Mycena rebaudengoi]|nr:hypothetical protein C8J57DRAFT_1562945 [Mycena rebaudengoi]
MWLAACNLADRRARLRKLREHNELRTDIKVYRPLFVGIFDGVYPRYTSLMFLHYVKLTRKPKWTFITTATPGVFTIQSTAGLFLSYPAAPNNGLTLGQAVLNKFPLTFNVQSVNPAANTVKIVEITSKVVLTSWPAEAGSTNSPLTFEVDTNRPEQIFTLAST